MLLTSSFLSTALEIYLICIGLSIQPQIGVHFRVGHSWQDYIYSPTTLYDGEEPYAIFSLISVLAVKPSPILPDFFIQIEWRPIDLTASGNEAETGTSNH